MTELADVAVIGAGMVGFGVARRSPAMSSSPAWSSGSSSDRAVLAIPNLGNQRPPDSITTLVLRFAFASLVRYPVHAAFSSGPTCAAGPAPGRCRWFGLVEHAGIEPATSAMPSRSGQSLHSITRPHLRAGNRGAAKLGKARPPDV